MQSSSAEARDRKIKPGWIWDLFFIFFLTPPRFVSGCRAVWRPRLLTQSIAGGCEILQPGSRPLHPKSINQTRSTSVAARRLIVHRSTSVSHRPDFLARTPSLTADLQWNETDGSFLRRLPLASFTPGLQMLFCFVVLFCFFVTGLQPITLHHMHSQSVLTFISGVQIQIWLLSVAPSDWSWILGVWLKPHLSSLSSLSLSFVFVLALPHCFLCLYFSFFLLLLSVIYCLLPVGS